MLIRVSDGLVCTFDFMMAHPGTYQNYWGGKMPGEHDSGSGGSWTNTGWTLDHEKLLAAIERMSETSQYSIDQVKLDDYASDSHRSRR